MRDELFDLFASQDAATSAVMVAGGKPRQRQFGATAAKAAGPAFGKWATATESRMPGTTDRPRVPPALQTKESAWLG